MPSNLIGHDLVQAGIPSDYLPVTPHDANDLPSKWVIGLYITGAGNIVVQMAGGVDRTIAVPANFFIPGNFIRVLATGTTATGIHAQIAAN